MAFRVVDVCLFVAGWLSQILSIVTVASRRWIHYGGNISEGLITGEIDGQSFPVGKKITENINQYLVRTVMLKGKYIAMEISHMYQFP